MVDERSDFKDYLRHSVGSKDEIHTKYPVGTGAKPSYESHPIVEHIDPADIKRADKPPQPYEYKSPLLRRAQRRQLLQDPNYNEE